MWYKELHECSFASWTCLIIYCSVDVISEQSNFRCSKTSILHPLRLGWNGSRWWIKASSENSKSISLHLILARWWSFSAVKIVAYAKEQWAQSFGETHLVQGGPGRAKANTCAAYENGRIAYEIVGKETMKISVLFYLQNQWRELTTKVCRRTY